MTEDGLIDETMTSSGILLAWTSSRKFSKDLSVTLRGLLAKHIDKDITQIQALAIMTTFDVGNNAVDKVRQAFLKKCQKESGL